jgi:hypothetical protein
MLSTLRHEASRPEQPAVLDVSGFARSVTDLHISRHDPDRGSRGRAGRGRGERVGMKGRCSPCGSPYRREHRSAPTQVPISCARPRSRCGLGTWSTSLRPRSRQVFAAVRPQRWSRRAARCFTGAGGRGGETASGGAGDCGTSTPKSNPQRRQTYRVLEKGTRVFWWPNSRHRK